MSDTVRPRWWRSWKLQVAWVVLAGVRVQVVLEALPGQVVQLVQVVLVARVALGAPWIRDPSQRDAKKHVRSKRGEPLYLVCVAV